VRLSELERHVLGWDRGADLLSGLIPQIYFDYLRGGPPERLVPVLNHNQMDLRGLAALSSRILSLLNDVENLGQDGLELYGVSRICEKRGEDTRARSLYEKSIASFLPIETDRLARRSLARLAKRQGDFQLASELWKDALGNSRHGFEAYEQLAIYYERRVRDPERAREIVLQGLDELRRAIQVGDIAQGPYREIKVRFENRLQRLERKGKSRSWKASRHRLRLKGQSDGRRTKTGFGNHGKYPCLSSSKDNRGSARQPAESANRVTGWLGRAVGGAHHEKDRWDVRKFGG
jgi:uncharacterized protein